MPVSPIARAVLPEATAARLRQIGERYGVRNIRVFGSVARGTARPGSDIDLLVDYVPGQTTERSLHPLIHERVCAEALRAG